MDSYLASNGPCFMVTWIIYKTHLLEVSLPQNRGTTTLQNLATFDTIICEDPVSIEIH